MAYAVAFLICAADIQPYLPGRKRELRRAKAGANGTPLSILLINVLQENEDHTAVISRIRDSHADVLFLSETNARWRDALSDLEKDYPHTYLLDKEDHNGLLFYSRYPINQAQERYFCQDHVPSLTMDIDMAGSEVRLYCIHPRPPRPRDDTQHLDDELMIVADELREQERPALVIGDFNEVG
ncbi:endonuclease/exonuclease/phosphatase family protein, partial [Hyphomonas sp. UBA5107]